MDGAQTCNMSSIGLHLYLVTLKARVSTTVIVLVLV